MTNNTLRTLLESANRDGLTDYDHVRTLDGDWVKVGDLRRVVDLPLDGITIDASIMITSVPDPYARELKALAATIPPPSSFERQYVAGLQRDLDATRRALDAEPRRVRALSADELSTYRAPDSFAADIAKLKEKIR